VLFVKTVFVCLHFVCVLLCVHYCVRVVLSGRTCVCLLVYEVRLCVLCVCMCVFVCASFCLFLCASCCVCVALVYVFLGMFCLLSECFSVFCMFFMYFCICFLYYAIFVFVCVLVWMFVLLFVL